MSKGRQLPILAWKAAAMDDLARYQAEARDYLNAVFLLKSMQKLGLLSERDYVVAEKAMAKKHSIKTGSVYRLYGLNT